MTKKNRTSHSSRTRTSSRISTVSKKHTSRKHVAKSAAVHAFRVVHFVAAVALVWLSITIWVLAPPKPAAAAAQGYPWYYEGERFLQIINNYRSGVGDGSLPMLSSSDCLTRAAHGWAKQMASSNSLTHSPDGYVSGYCGIGAHAENALVANEVLEPVAQRAFDTWLNSPWHQLNMRTDYTHTGVAFFFDEAHAKIWGVQLFMQCSTPGYCGAAITNSPNNPQTNAAACREVSVPSTLSVGQTFRPMVIWTNTGTSIWPFTYKVATTNNVWGKTRVDFESFTPSEYANPGWAAGIYNHTFTAPATPGTYEFLLQPTNSGGAAFGARCGKTITVTGSAATAPGGSKPSAKSGQSSTGATGDTPEEQAGTPETSKQSDSQDSPSKAHDTQKSIVSAPEDTAPLKQPTSIIGELQSASLPIKASIAGATAIVVFAFILFHTRIFSLLHKAVATAARLIKRK